MVQQDKIEHWAFGFVLSIGVIWSPWLFIPGVVFAVGKEIWDMKHGKYDLLDIMATMVGVICMALFAVVVR